MARGSVKSYFLKNGTKMWMYTVDLPREMGKRQQKLQRGFESEKEAEKALRDVLHKLDNNQTPAKKTRLKEVIDEFASDYKEKYKKGYVKYNTWRKNDQIIRNYLFPIQTTAHLLTQTF